MGLDLKRIGLGAATLGLSEFGGDLTKSLDPVNRAEELYGTVDADGKIAGRGDTVSRQAGLSYLQQQGSRQQQQALFNGIQNRMASGNTVSGEMLRQGLQQNLSAQRSLAAGASPANSAMAARQAAMQTGKLGAGLAGQQATAGMQERLGDEQNLGSMLQAQNAQDSANLNSQNQSALTSYGMNQQSLDNRYSAAAKAPTGAQSIMSGVVAAAPAAAAMSDRRAKTQIRDGDTDADKFARALKAYSYKYKDPKHGEGERLGVMAQDMEKSRMGRSVVSTSKGGAKMLDNNKLASALAAVVARQQGRLDKLEKNSK